MILCWGGQGHPPTDAATLDAIATIVRAGRRAQTVGSSGGYRNRRSTVTRRESTRRAPCAVRVDGAITTALNTLVMVPRCLWGEQVALAAAGSRLPAGTPIQSVTTSVARVTLGHGSDFGNSVQVHVGNLWIRYAHLEAALVSDGDQVAPGTVLELERSTGFSTGPASPLRGRPRLPGRDLLDRSVEPDLAAGRGLMCASQCHRGTARPGQ
jgi:hypothetical protein